MTLESLTTDVAGRRSEYRKRRSPFVEETIPASKLEEHEAAGWTVARTYKTGTLRVRNENQSISFSRTNAGVSSISLDTKILTLAETSKLL